MTEDLWPFVEAEWSPIATMAPPEITLAVSCPMCRSHPPGFCMAAAPPPMIRDTGREGGRKVEVGTVV